jgi:hypothetical protein
LAEKYSIHPDVVFDVYTKGMEAYRKILKEYLEANEKKQ